MTAHHYDPAHAAAAALHANRRLEAMAVEGQQALAALGAIKGTFARGMIKRELGMSLDELAAEVHAVSALLAGIESGAVSLHDAQPRLERYRSLVHRTIAQVRAMEGLLGQYARTPAARERVRTEALERIAIAESVIDALEELVTA